MYATPSRCGAPFGATTKCPQIFIASKTGGLQYSRMRILPLLIKTPKAANDQVKIYEQEMSKKRVSKKRVSKKMNE